MLLTDDQIDEIGFVLEEGGFSHSDIDDWFEHHGVKGMKWGKRTANIAGRVGSSVGRGAKATGKFAWNHKKAIASVATGAVIAKKVLEMTYFPPTKFKYDTKAANKIMNMNGKIKMSNLSAAAKNSSIRTTSSVAYRIGT